MGISLLARIAYAATMNTSLFIRRCAPLPTDTGFIRQCIIYASRLILGLTFQEVTGAVISQS